MSHANSYRLSGLIQARRMMTTTRCWFVSAPLFTCLFLGYLRAGSGQAPPQTPPPGGNAAAAAPATGATIPAVSAKEKPIRDLVDSFAKAYSTPDLKALAASSPTKPMSSIQGAKLLVASRPSWRCMHRRSRKTRG